MGYCIDVHICVSKEDLPILFSYDNMDMFECSYRDENIVYAHVNDVKIGGWWDDLQKIIEQCKEYHWITIGEDGEQAENYSHEPMMSIITTVDVPSKVAEVDITKPKLYQEVFNILKLSLPNEYEITPQGTYIQYKGTDLSYMYTVDNKVYIRRYTYKTVNSINLFQDILNILSNSYMLICITPGIYEIKYKP